MTDRFITLNDALETCLDPDLIKAIIGVRDELETLYSVVIDIDGQQYRSDLKPSEVRARIAAAMEVPLNS